MKTYKLITVALLALAFFGCNTVVKKEESPTDVLKKFVEASQKKDVEGIKQTLSAPTLKMTEDSAKKQGMTLDDALKKDNGSTLKGMPEMRNEQITGETATVEVKNEATSDWDKIPFVKEDGKWKIALDKFMQDLMQKLSQQMKAPDVPKSSTDAANSNASANNKKP